MMAVGRFGLVVAFCSVIAAATVARNEKVEKRGLLEDMGLRNLLSGIMSQVNKKIENAMKDPNGKKTVVSDSVVSSGNETKRITITSYFDPDDKNNSTVVQPGNNSTNNGSSLVTGTNSTKIEHPLLAGNNSTINDPSPVATAGNNSTSTVPTAPVPSAESNTTPAIIFPLNLTFSGTTTAPVGSSTNISETATNKTAIT